MHQVPIGASHSEVSQPGSRSTALGCSGERADRLSN